jgi:pimeloyl-ACP methyl ester carboxylesterase
MTRPRLPIETRTVESFDGTRICYHLAGKPDGEPMVLSNGLGGNIAAWRHLIDYFGDRYRIVSWDYRGLYASEPAADGTAYEVQDHVRDLCAVLDQECIELPILLGWSMGVQVNFEFQREHKDRARALVAINGTYGSPFKTALRSEVLEGLMPRVFELVRRYWRTATPVTPYVASSRAFVWTLQRMGLVGHTIDMDMFFELAAEYVKLDFGIYMDIFERLGNHDAWDVLPTVAVPVLIVAGEKDLFTPATVARRMADALPDAELFVVPSATHYCPLEFAELLALRIEKFLRTKLD